MSELAVASVDPFESRAIGRLRLVWAPDVHEHYSEKCSFFLVRLVSPHLSRGLDLAELLEKASIKSFSVYPVYGHFDFLIRMWVTPQKRARFLRLVNNQNLFDEVDEFQAKRIDYLHDVANEKNGVGVDNHRVSRFLPDIQRVCVDIAAGNRPDQADLQRLIKSGLVYALRPAGSDEAPDDGQLYQFFFSLSRIPSPNRTARETELVSIREFLVNLQKEAGVRQIILNEGIGFADYLISGVVPNYYSIFECNRRLIDLLDHFKFSLRPETFLTGTPDPRESDSVDVTWREFGGEELRLEGALPPVFAADLANLQRQELLEITDVFMRYETRFIDTPFEPFFKDLLCARISRDRDLLATAMGVTHRIEGYAKDFFREQWVREFGSRWVAELKEAGTRVGLATFDPKKPTLKEAIDVSNSIPGVSSRVTNILGDSWNAEIVALLPYRNDLSHGVIFTDREYVVTHWAALSKALLGAGLIYNRLYAIFHQNNQSPR